MDLRIFMATFAAAILVLAGFAYANPSLNQSNQTSFDISRFLHFSIPAEFNISNIAGLLHGPAFWHNRTASGLHRINITSFGTRSLNGTLMHKHWLRFLPGNMSIGVLHHFRDPHRMMNTTG